MRTDVVVYASEALMAQIRKDLSLEQAMNVATLPGIVGSSLAMPDIHQGYGFPIGGVAAMDCDDGVVSPGGVGFDINCGVRLVRTTLEEGEVRPRLRELVEQIFRDVRCGVGGSGFVKIGARDLERILVEGADPTAVFERARERGLPQLGTLGSGNHYLEVQYVEEVLDETAARAYGIRQGQVVVLIHSGSRGLGH